MFDFQKLEVYSKAKTFNSSVQKLLQSANNINSSSRNQLQKEFFCNSQRINFECAAIFDFWRDENIISANQFSKLFYDCEELSKMLYALIKKLGLQGE